MQPIVRNGEVNRRLREMLRFFLVSAQHHQYTSVFPYLMKDEYAIRYST